MIKGKLRTLLKEKRKSLPAERRKLAPLSLAPHLHTLQKVLSFASFGEEIDLWEINQFFAQKKELILPKVEGETLLLFHVENLKEQLARSSLGILEPIPEKCRPALFEEIRYVLVPGLGFDAHNQRLGYGKGYYDRLLPQLKNAVKIGVGFQEQLLDEPLPCEPHDFPLDQLLLT